VLMSAHALFCLATATTCTSPSKLPTLFSPGSVNGLLTQVLVCNYCWTSLVPRPSNPASVTYSTDAAECLVNTSRTVMHIIYMLDRQWKSGS